MNLQVCHQLLRSERILKDVAYVALHNKLAGLCNDVRDDISENMSIFTCFLINITTLAHKLRNDIQYC